MHGLHYLTTICLFASATKTDRISKANGFLGLPTSIIQCSQKWYLVGTCKNLTKKFLFKAKLYDPKINRRNEAKFLFYLLKLRCQKIKFYFRKQTAHQRLGHLTRTRCWLGQPVNSLMMPGNNPWSLFGRDCVNKRLLLCQFEV